MACGLAKHHLTRGTAVSVCRQPRPAADNFRKWPTLARKSGDRGGVLALTGGNVIRRRLAGLAVLAVFAVAVPALAGCAPESPADAAAASAPDAAVGDDSSRSPASTTALPLPSTPSSAPPSDVSPSHGGFVVLSGDPSGNLGFHDQVSDGWQLVGAAEIDGSGGWVVVRADHGGVPGPVIGSVYRANEAHDDVVTVRLVERVASGPLWVSLNVDAGRTKQLELPGPDLPVQFAGADLATRLVLTVR